MRLRAFTIFALGTVLLPFSSLCVRAGGEETILHATTLETARTPVRQTPTASWPSIGRQTALRLSERKGVWDGVPMSYAKIEGRNLDLELRFTDLEYWTRVTPTRGRYGLEFAFQWNPNVILGLAAFPRVRPFNDLSDTTWKAYTASLATRPNCRIHTDDDSQRNGQMLVVLDGRTRIIDYTATDESTESAFRTVQVWIELNDSILVFSMEGPNEAVNQAKTAFESVLRSISFAE